MILWIRFLMSWETGHTLLCRHTKRMTVEAFYYLSNFKDKRGTISKVIKKPSLQYEVEVGNQVAHVYHDELKLGWLK